jgi:hypothetical protein
MDQRARHSRYSRNPFRAGHVFGATLVRNCYGLSGCSPPSTDLTSLPANGGFYFQAFSGSVALPAAGYNYNSVWTPLLAGLSPAGMAASLAALVRPCPCPASKRSWQGAPKTRSTPCLRHPIPRSPCASLRGPAPAQPRLRLSSSTRKDRLRTAGIGRRDASREMLRLPRTTPAD